MKYYFTSDVHLGLSLKDRPAKERETRFLKWLDRVEEELYNNGAPSTGALFLLGDIFDYWLEYKSVVPKQHIKVLAKLENMTSKGITIYYFKGNHDTWTYNYFESIGVKVHYKPEILTLDGKRFMVAHGHNLMVNKAPLGYRLMYATFNSKFLLWMFRTFIHVDVSNWFGSSWSNKTRVSKSISHIFQKENEPAVKFARKKLSEGEDVDYFVFGHLHTPIIYDLECKNSKLIILGEWIENPTFGVFENEIFILENLSL